MRGWLPLALLALAACSTAPKKTASSHLPGPAGGTVVGSPASAGCIGRYAPAQEDPSTRGDYVAGGLYKPGVADTTPDHVPDIACIAEPQVVDLPPSSYGNRSPYVVLDREYRVLTRTDGYVEQGTASYYGAKFHGRKTSNHEVYDMYAFTAAHKTLPLPSFALVTNLDNGQSVVVRVNDRGPFHDGRVVDLSYAAAVKLGITPRGTGRVEVQALTTSNAGRVLAQRGRSPAPTPVMTTVATGVPTRVATGQPTPMDHLVQQLPAKAPAPAQAPSPAIAAAPAARAPAQPPAARGSAVPAAASSEVASSSPGQPWRYHARADTTRAPSAQSFDAWMQSRGVRVATGKPAAPATPAAAGMAAARAPVAQVPAATQPAASSPMRSVMPAVAMAAAAPAAVLLQVASFASRENADRALAQLTAAGIAGASLSDTRSDGRTLWRVRVAAADDLSAQTLASRIAGLGFGPPRPVRE